ncbi:MAG TPA: hypothetical protein V6C57_04625, partial [Coleofasciculaceae cyanobacterium]
GSCLKCVQKQIEGVNMEFPITNLLDRANCIQWIVEHFHPDGFGCPNCEAGVEQARKFRTTRRSQLTVYRCRQCHQTYNLYSGTMFEQHHLTPEQVVLLIRGIVKGESSKSLASELQLSYQTVLHLRQGVSRGWGRVWDEISENRNIKGKRATPSGDARIKQNILLW